jgi:hemoglobin/transferrin/lactoferrin receptor protein
MPPKHISIALALTLLTGATSHAETIVITATRGPVNTMGTSVATTVVGREALHEGSPQTVMDALHGETGTFVQQTTPGQAVVIVRGLKGSEVLHLVDGFRLNNAIFRNAPNQYMALVDSQALEGLEVVRGPMSALYGGDAMGGVVQMLSATPQFSDSGVKSSVRLRTSWASADRSSLARVEARVANDAFALIGGFTLQDVNSLRVGEGTRLPYTAYSARAANLKMLLQPAAGHQITVQGQMLEQPSTPRYDELIPGFGQTLPTSSTFVFEPQRREFAQLRWRADDVLPGIDMLDAQFGRQTITDNRRNRDFGTTNEDREANRVTSDGISVTAALAPLGLHRVTLGLEHYADTVKSFRDRLNINTNALSARPSRFPDGSTQAQTGVFVSDEWQVSRDTLLSGGLRYSRVKVDVPPVINNTGVAVSESDLSGNLGANVKLPWAGAGNDLRLIANIGRGFRAPNVFDLGTFGSRPGNRFNVPNPNLKPERVTTVDAGFKFANTLTQAELFVFRSRYEDKITSVLTGDVAPGGALIVQSRNATQLSLRGIEAGVNHRIVPGLSVRATATWTRGSETIGATTDAADRVPPLFGRLGLRWDVTTAVDLDVNLLYASRQDRLSQRDLIDPRINPAGTAGWATANARVGWRPSARLRLGLQASNLADKRYREHGSGLDEPGRSLMATVEVRL